MHSVHQREEAVKHDDSDAVASLYFVDADVLTLNDAAQASNVAFLTQLGNDWINKYKEQGNKSLSLAADWIHRKIYSFEEAFNWYISFQKDIIQNMKICFYFDLKFLKTKGKEDTIYYYVSILPSSNDNNIICLV